MMIAEISTGCDSGTSWELRPEGMAFCTLLVGGLIVAVNQMTHRLQQHPRRYVEYINSLGASVLLVVAQEAV